METQCMLHKGAGRGKQSVEVRGGIGGVVAATTDLTLNPGFT